MKTARLYDQLKIGKPGHGPLYYNPIAYGTSLVVNQKAPGRRKIAGNDTTGSMGVPNPLFVGNKTRGALMPHSFMFGNQYQQRQHLLFQLLSSQDRNSAAHSLFTAQHHRWTPLPLTNAIELRVRRE